MHHFFRKKSKAALILAEVEQKNAQFLGCWFLLFYDVSSFANLLSAFGHARSGAANTRIQAIWGGASERSR